MNLVTLQDIVFGYSHTPVLDGVSLEIKSGEFVGITGPNGASKSTLMKVMLGMLRPWEGTAEISKKKRSRKTPDNRLCSAADFFI